jgi:hypothetical protein
MAAMVLRAADPHAVLTGVVTFNTFPVPGATVTATRDKTTLTTTTDLQGIYSFDAITDGNWTLNVQMLGFAPMEKKVDVTSANSATTWELKLLPLDQIQAHVETAPAPQQPAPQPETKKSAEPAPAAASAARDLSDRAADGLLINGSMINGAASPFAQMAAFGNTRSGSKGLYNGGLGLTFDNSAFDANQFSVTGQSTPKPEYNRLTGLLTFGGPLRIPHLLRRGPFVFVGYQWTRNRNATIEPALVPTAAERMGFVDGRQIPASQISPQAEALLNLYPLPNFNGSGYNYQVPLVSPTHQDALQTRFNKGIGMRDEIYGRFNFQSTRTDNPSLFNFLDTNDTLGINTGINWQHRFGHHISLNICYQYSYFSTHTKPYFEDRENVSGLAGITGNNQQPANWGPPTLVFSSGIASLTDAQSAFNRNQTGAVSPSLLWNRGNHTIQFGGDFRREQFNYLSQQNGRGTFSFTGAATGSDFGDFLLGIPDSSVIAFGNADKYFRESVYDTFVNDDWRISPEFSLNVGVRWEYGAPITELYGRLVNLDIGPGFSSAAPLVSNNTIKPDREGMEPRIGMAWRPLSGSSLVVRAGYGIYDDTSVYQTIATQMAQQAPLSKSLSVQNSAADPLTLASGFNASPLTTPDTFAVDPHFRVGYAQNWQVSLQRDLPGSLQMTATYLGIKGTRGLQEFLPNTYPAGAANPCPACPVGFAYLTSNGNSERESGSVQLRRRLHDGFTGLLQYTFSKSLDEDAALGGSVTAQTTAAPGASSSSVTAPSATGQQGLQIAQNWLNLKAERSLSTFNQQNVLSLQLQYTTGMGVGGGTLLSGWKGMLLKEWTFATLITAGSGLPQTPVYYATVDGTGFTGTIRPDDTGQPLYASPAGLHLNPAAYTALLAGEWGNAGRNSITGPAQFNLNASLGRTFRLNDRFNLDFRVDSTNALNHVTFTDWNTTINSPQFGLPVNANAMRSMQTTLRLRF